MNSENYTWKSWIPRLAMDHPYKMLGIILLLTVFFTAFFPWIKINTDPEDMLPEDHPARVKDRTIHEQFFLHDIVAVAIEPPNDKTNFTVKQLERVHRLIEKVKKQEGVISGDILSIYTSDDIEGSGVGLNVDRLLRTPPDNKKQIDKLITRVQDHPVLKGMILNRQNGGLAFFVPVEAKNYSYPVRQTIRGFWKKQPDSAGTIHITGLPVAESTFGVEMFYQMATSAPLAFIIIGLIMLWFFRSFSLVFWALSLAVITVLWTMGGLIGLGFPVHIMSSMIPIFLLPVAVVDSIHILSDFAERTREGTPNRQVLTGVFEEIFFPILFTSLTSAAGFISLSMTGIPPVQVFGVAVGLGILLAFVMTLTVLPAGAIIWPPGSTSNQETSWLGSLVKCSGNGTCFARDYPQVIIAGLVLLLGLGLYGMTLIEVNDNPTRWFMEGHPIREADDYFNETFAGSYPAYWVLEKKKGGWDDPEALRRLEDLLNKIEQTPMVGKMTALPAVVNKIHRELHGGQAKSRFPDSQRAVRQYLFLYQNSGNPQDLFRLVTSDGRAVNVWFNLKSGDNKVMARVKNRASALLEQSPIQLKSEPKWGGITVVNLTWQNVMVHGMAWALAGSYLVIFFMMLFLFRSVRWALMSLVPLTTTLVLVYGLVGWTGKDYDMPVAVLSALSIGIAVDFAIHYIQRSRQIMQENGPWPSVREKVTGEPALAIARNAIVIAIGFSPLLVAPLRPYVTVGVFMMLIMAIAGVTTLVGLFSLFEQFHSVLPDESESE